MEYKFTGGEEEEKKPLEEREIVKNGEVSKFSLVAMKSDFIKYAKLIKEMAGNRDLKLATMKNIEEHHPFVKEIPEFDRYTIHMYQEACASFNAFDAKVKELEKEVEEYQAELEEIQKQIPELAPVVSPYMQKEEEAAGTDVSADTQKANDQENAKALEYKDNQTIAYCGANDSLISSILKKLDK